ncbi:MAG: phospholipid/cholesterol/gamma-HCH transport system substrate-binding protein [Actinomycetota bacterium]|jgi:virulence factor Mce-like protein|nr:phospholipid/cholesterol/gamma-HCH transport system substrate-binding protein [Actinomycetota bacterium]
MVVLTGLVLTGRIHSRYERAYATFDVCGEGLRVGGDVKERGVLVGSVGDLQLIDGHCRVALDLQPDQLHVIPANVGAEINAKTLFGEKWVELLYPQDPQGTIAAGDEIGLDRTINPIEVESILNEALPLLKAINPDKLAGFLTALAEGFGGHESAAVRGLVEGNRALIPLNQDTGLVKKGIDQLAGSAAVLDNVRGDLISSLRSLDSLNRFTISNSSLIASNLRKTPVLLDQLSTLFEVHFNDLTRIVDRGATVIGVLASRAVDVDHLLTSLPIFNAKWNANLNDVCRFRQPTTEPGKAQGDVVPGKCWRVHNLISQSRGPYAPGTQPKPHAAAPGSLRQVLYAPSLGAQP